MKYKVTKSFLNFSENGSTISDPPEDYHIVSGIKVPYSMLIEQGFIEEVKETPKPKFVVGEYVTCEYEDGTKKYLNIHEICLDSEDKYEYNRYFAEEDLREPTPEELKIYFA